MGAALATAASPPAFQWPVRVYYEDTDAGGVVYHASYLCFFERARTEWLRTRGIAQARLAAERGLIFTMVEMDLRFRAPARLDDLLQVSCVLGRCHGASMRFDQEIRRVADQGLLASASSRAACLDAALFKPRPIPNDLLELLSG